MFRPVAYPTRLAVLSIGCAVLLTAAPAALCAQESSTVRSADLSAQCVLNIPDSALKRVRVLVQAELTDTVDQPLLPQIDLLTQGVAAHARTLLGASPDSLPEGEPAVTWRDLGPDLLVVIHHRGQTTWEVSAPAPSPNVRYDTVRTAAYLLGRALAQVDSEYSDVLVAWPEGFAPDSVAFRLVVRRPRVDEHGTVRPYRVRRAFPLLSINVPTEVPAAQTRKPHVAYPQWLQQKGVSGNLIMMFVVDTTGRADMATVKDFWPSSLPRLTGDKADYYESLRQAIINALRDARYEPARIGGCKVRQLVQQPFTFDFDR